MPPENKKEDKELNLLSFLAPDYLLFDLLEGKRMPVKFSDVFAPFPGLIVLVVLGSTLGYFLWGNDSLGGWIKYELFAIGSAIVLYLIVFLIKNFTKKNNENTKN